MRVADDPCDVVGPAEVVCASGGGSGGRAGAGTGPLDELDPVTSLAKSAAEAAAWTARKVGDILADPSSADFTSGPFLRQYAIVFAASTILVMLLWLLAVAKRAVKGVPPTTAISEAVGLLWLSVVVTAFAPAALYVVIQASSGITRLLGSAFGADGETVYDTLAKQLLAGELGGGPIVLFIVSLLVMALCGAVGLLMILRTLALPVGALLGIPIFAGLVDKDLWRHSRWWAAGMAGIIAIEPIVVVIIGLASAVQAGDSIVTGVGITAIAVVVAGMLVIKFPGWGDSVRVMRQTARGVGAVGGAALGTAGAATGVIQGIHTHGSRNGTPPRTNNPGGSSKESSGGGVAGGISAHGTRAPKPRSGDTDKRADSDS